MTLLSVSRTVSFVAALAFGAVAASADPLPSWNDTAAKQRITDFVDAVTDPDGSDYVTPADRIAVFDNDGTLWAEQPLYFQVVFAVDVIGEMAKDDPSTLTSDVLKAAANKDYKAVIDGGEEALVEVMKTSHSGMTVEVFQSRVADWMATARHPDTGLPFNEMTYQPMVELLRYLRDEGFKTYIVSGGGIHFMRVLADQAYNIPNEQVIGSYGMSEYKMIDGTPTIVKSPAIGFNDDKEGKPINIDRIIGKRPIIAGGNSDGDFAMIEWTTAGDGPRLGLFVHHTDADREYAYDRDSHIGKLAKGLDEASQRGWLIVDMAKDWARIYTGRQ